jgi:hypothetical protein
MILKKFERIKEVPMTTDEKERLKKLEEQVKNLNELFLLVNDKIDASIKSTQHLANAISILAEEVNEHRERL